MADLIVKTYRIQGVSMSRNINDLIDRIAKLENQLVEEIREQEKMFHYKLEGTRVKFEDSVLEAQRKLKVAIFPGLKSSRIRSVISVPCIYSMIVPIVIMDITITLYQHICFRLYDISRVKRSDYIVMDRHQLSYLNGIEKFNCVYCGYGNGVMGYAREVIARTEQYWCPIKHARKVVGTHKRYRKFLGYGEVEDYQAKVIKLRDDLRPVQTEEPDQC